MPALPSALIPSHSSAKSSVVVYQALQQMRIYMDPLRPISLLIAHFGAYFGGIEDEGRPGKITLAALAWLFPSRTHLRNHLTLCQLFLLLTRLLLL